MTGFVVEFGRPCDGCPRAGEASGLHEVHVGGGQLLMVRLFQSWYPESIPRRAEELRNCLQANLALACVDQVCLLLERGAVPPLTHPKLRFRAVTTRPTYQDFFRWANELCVDRHDITAIANSDIYFDQTLRLLVEELQPHQCSALSRWDVRADGTAVLFDRNDSQDVWVFRGPVRKVVADYCVGIPRCDNRILFELRQAGYRVINPALTVRAMHLHAGLREEYPGELAGPFVPGPYEYLYPHNLLSLPALMQRKLAGTAHGAVWTVDWRLWRTYAPDRVLRRLLRRLIRRGRQL